MSELTLKNVGMRDGDTVVLERLNLILDSGTFGAVVGTVDPVVSPNGRFRVLLVPDPDDAPWPSNAYLRFGAQARGWILLDTVSVGYELWRRLNGFPPEVAPIDKAGGASRAPKIKVK